MDPPGKVSHTQKPRFHTLHLIKEHLMPSGKLPGSEPSETVWTGCDGPPRASWAARRAQLVGLGSWIFIGFLTVWLHVFHFGSFVDAFPYVFGANILVFVWVLVGVAILGPVFLRRSRRRTNHARESR